MEATPKKPIEPDSVVQIIASGDTPGHVGLLGYAGATTDDRTAVSVYSVPQNPAGNAAVMKLSIPTVDLFVVGLPDLVPNP